MRGTVGAEGGEHGEIAQQMAAVGWLAEARGSEWMETAGPGGVWRRSTGPE